MGRFIVFMFILALAITTTARSQCTAIPGDANSSGSHTLSDVIATINFIFNRAGFPPCQANDISCWLSGLPCRGNWNGDDFVTLADVIQAVNFIFQKSGGNWNPFPKEKCSQSVGLPSGEVLLVSNNWLWTQDDRGGGSQGSLSIEGDSVVVGPVDHVHFVNSDTAVGGGIYQFEFRGNNFKFAWRISPQNSSQGTGLIFQKAPTEQMALIHVKWDGFFYGWHNSGDQFRNTIPDTFSTDTWHTVTISDNDEEICIQLDGVALDFFGESSIPVDSFFVDVGEGYMGVGNGDSSTVKYHNFLFVK